MSEGTSVKVGTIDIGSNSIVLLIADCSPDGTIKFVDEHYALTKLGKDVKSKRLLSDEAVDHTIAAVKELKELAEQSGVQDIIVTTSSAIRMAENRNQFLVKCYREINIFPQVLSGKEEAEYTYQGATMDLKTNRPIVTIDVGGGSTEISWGTKDKMVEAHSFDIGCVNLQEQFAIGTKYVLYKRIAARRLLRQEFSKISSPLESWVKDRRIMVLATGGSITTYAGIQLHEEIYDRDKINHMKIRTRELSAVSRRLAKMDIKTRKRVPGMILDRAYDLPAGLMIFSEFLRYFKFHRFYISCNGLRAGILKHYADKYKTDR